MEFEPEIKVSVQFGIKRVKARIVDGNNEKVFVMFIDQDPEALKKAPILFKCVKKAYRKNFLSISTIDGQHVQVRTEDIFGYVTQENGHISVFIAVNKDRDAIEVGKHLIQYITGVRT